MKIRKLYQFLLFIWLISLGNLCFAAGTILILGDSLSAAYNIPEASSWVTLLKVRLQEQNLDYTIQNASVVGITSSQSLDKLPDLLKQYKPQIVIVELGGNDGLRGLPIFMIRQNLVNIIETIKNANAQVLLIGIKLPMEIDEGYRGQFEQLYPDLSSKYSIPLVPFLLAGVADKPGALQDDHIHPTAAVEPQILENVWGYLAPLLKNP